MVPRRGLEQYLKNPANADAAYTMILPMPTKMPTNLIDALSTLWPRSCRIVE